METQRSLDVGGSIKLDVYDTLVSRARHKLIASTQRMIIMILYSRDDSGDVTTYAANCVTECTCMVSLISAIRLNVNNQ